LQEQPNLVQLLRCLAAEILLLLLLVVMVLLVLLVLGRAATAASLLAGPLGACGVSVKVVIRSTWWVRAAEGLLLLCWLLLPMGT
jgi:hypothetical protein